MNEYDEYNVIMIAVVMNDVSFELMMDMKRENDLLVLSEKTHLLSVLLTFRDIKGKTDKPSKKEHNKDEKPKKKEWLFC